ncbi:MAG: hypothetical protein IPO90_01945 [Flavobacteriales bacterium]|nr:hypothetical protein [Flavobacteriales bacterium]
MIALPDICDYHNKDVETSWLFDLFFPAGGAGGGHPAPGLVFNLTALAGGIGAGILAFRLMKKVLTRNGVKADAQEIR